jgi:hypothetical protein
MKFIPPLEIASQLMTLIQEAESELVLVSPYINIRSWDKMKKCLSKAVERGVNVTFYVRNHNKQDVSDLIDIGIKPILIENLHAKLYYNETYGIVTSLNLYYYSDQNSIEIAYKTQGRTERAELVAFVNRYILNANPYKGAINTFTPSQNGPFNSNKAEVGKTKLTNNQVEQIYQNIKTNFIESKITKTATYVFCGNLVPFGDIIIDSEYVLKVKKHVDNHQVLKAIEDIGFLRLRRFNIQLVLTHNRYYYLHFRPVIHLNFQDLIDDFIFLTKEILLVTAHPPQHQY